jgi:hypothetical protein
MLNLMNIQPGQIIRLKAGTNAEVVENVGDGMWLSVRFESGDEELVFCEDIESIVEVQL